MRTIRSTASSRFVGDGPANALSTSGLARPTDGSPVVDITEVSERTRPGCSIATVWAIAPPSEAPTRCALSSPSASSSPTESAAMSERVYEAEDVSPASAAMKSGFGASEKCDDKPLSRLSKRIGCTPRATSSAQKPSGQPISCAPIPITSRTGGACGSPRRSYTTSIPAGPTFTARSSPMATPHPLLGTRCARQPAAGRGRSGPGATAGPGAVRDPFTGVAPRPRRPGPTSARRGGRRRRWSGSPRRRGRRGVRGPPPPRRGPGARRLRGRRRRR